MSPRFVSDRFENNKKQMDGTTEYDAFGNLIFFRRVPIAPLCFLRN